MGAKKNWVGLRFGMLVVLEELEGRYVRAQCDCGGVTTPKKNNLQSGNTRSCGCMEKAARYTNRLTHGKTETETYRIWCYMRKRCLNKRASNYGRYGGKGVTIDPRWDSFENFLADMGERPSGMTLDRIDSSKGYGPDNCRWATYAEQNRNKSNNIVLFLNGDFVCLADIARVIGWSYSACRGEFLRSKRDHEHFIAKLPAMIDKGYVKGVRVECP